LKYQLHILIGDIKHKWDQTIETKRNLESELLI